MQGRTSIEQSLASEPEAAKYIASSELIWYRKLGEQGTVSQRTFWKFLLHTEDGIDSKGHPSSIAHSVGEVFPL